MLDRVPPGQILTKNAKWPVLHTGLVPDYDLARWDFKTLGLVEKPLTLSWEEFQKLPRIKLTADMHCVTTWTCLDMEWEGVSFRTIAVLATKLYLTRVHGATSFVHAVALSWARRLTAPAAAPAPR